MGHGTHVSLIVHQWAACHRLSSSPPTKHRRTVNPSTQLRSGHNWANSWKSQQGLHNLNPFLVPAARTLLDGPRLQDGQLPTAGLDVEQPGQALGELLVVLEAGAVLADLDELGEARVARVGEDGQAGAEHVDDLHGEVDARGAHVQADAEVGGGEQAGVVGKGQEGGADGDVGQAAGGGEAGDAGLVGGALRAAARDDDEQGHARGRGAVAHEGVEQEGKVLVGRPRGAADEQADAAGHDGVGEVGGRVADGAQVGGAPGVRVAVVVTEGAEDVGGPVVHGGDGRADAVGGALQLGLHGVGDGEVGAAEAAEGALVELGDAHKGVVAAAGARQDGPAVVVPVNDEARVAGPADHRCHQQGGNRGWVLETSLASSPGRSEEGGREGHGHTAYLDKKPPRRLCLVQQDREQVHDLPDHLDGPGDDEGEGLEALARRRNQCADLDIAVVDEGGDQ